MSVASQHLNTLVIDTSSTKVNSLVKITTPTSFPQSGAIAVTANERIAAVLAAELLPAHTDHIYTMIDEHTLQSGINRLSVSALLSSENCKEYNPTDMAYDR